MAFTRVQTIRADSSRYLTPNRVRIGYETDNMVERLEFVLPVINEVSQSAVLMMSGDNTDVAILHQGDNGRYGVDLTSNLIGKPGVTVCYVRIDGAGGEQWHSNTLKLLIGDLNDVENEVEKQYPTAVGQMLSEIAEHRAEMAESMAELEQLNQQVQEGREELAESLESAEKAADQATASASQAESAARKAGSAASRAETAAEGASLANGQAGAAASRAATAADRAERAAASIPEDIGKNKVDRDQGQANAGKLLYVDSYGMVVPLRLGAGLEIRDGVLVVVGSGTGGGDTVIAELTVDENGNAILTGATLTVDAEGNATITGATLTVDEDGNAVLA